MQLYDILAALFYVLDDTIKLQTNKKTLRLWVPGGGTVRTAGDNLLSFLLFLVPPPDKFLAVSPQCDRKERDIFKGSLKILLSLRQGCRFVPSLMAELHLQLKVTYSF